MIASILLGLVVWFLLSIPVGIVVGKMLARANQATMPLVPAVTMRDTSPTRPAPLRESMGYVSPISRISGD